MKQPIIASTQIAGHRVRFYRYNTVIVGAGAAGMNCAVHLYEFMRAKGIAEPQERIVVVTAGLGLGASRMSGSDKQTYYKLGTSAEVADSAEAFAETLMAGGCCHGDLALAEAVGSLREFHHLVQAGVEFPTDAMGSFVGYKTDHDPAERATSAGPKTSKFMSEALQRQLEDYGVYIADQQELVHLLVVGSGQQKRLAGVVTVAKAALAQGQMLFNVYLGANVVLAAGGPGALYKASVYPLGQVGIHGLAFRAGLVGVNLTESQFGLASTKFRWNVSGTYMQAIPRIFSTDAAGEDQRDFLADYFPSMSKMASAIFLKGYQWPFDPQRIEGFGSSLIDVLVFQQRQLGRRVFLDFRQNPVPGRSMEPFSIDKLEPEACAYLRAAGALQETPIERLAWMNPLAIELYREHGIDLYSEPLEVAVCAQHNNGGFAVDKWWQSNIRRTFVIGEMAGTHGVKRPGGSALNAGQVGGLRAAEYIVNVYGAEPADYASQQQQIREQLGWVIERIERWRQSGAMNPAEVIEQIQQRMTDSAGHIRQLDDARRALGRAVELYRRIQREGLRIGAPVDTVMAVQAEHLALTSVAYLKAIVELLACGSGSRGSHLVLAEDGVEIHPDIVEPYSSKPLRLKPENESLRRWVLEVEFDEQQEDLFRCRQVPVRPIPRHRKAFELAWKDFREGKIYL